MAAEHTTASDTRFRISRAGVLNVWQYDEQVFVFADGRLLLRGANGAGKSKTMEMLLPFVIDGDKRRLTASGRHHTSLVWLMLDGYDGAGRTGYVWVEFRRALADGSTETTTCGVGLRATASAREATAWFFTSPRRVGIDLLLENESGPLSRAALAAEVESDGRGRVFDKPSLYRAHVGELLFGLPADQYEALLRLLYWLRQPQVGEDIDPKRLAEQLVNALPVVDTDTLRSAGDTFDELQAFGEEIDRRERSATALADFVGTYAAYARSVVAERGERALTAASEVTAARRRVGRTEREHSDAVAELETTMAAREAAEAAHGDALARIRTLETSPEATSRQHLIELGKRVATLATAAERDHRLVASAEQRAGASAAQADTTSAGLYARTQKLHTLTEAAASALAGCGGTADPAPSAALLSKRPGWRPPADPVTDGASIVAAGQAHDGWARDCGVVAGALAAAVTIVEVARSEAERARDRAAEAQRLADATEGRAEAARGALAEAKDRTQAEESAFLEQLSEWRAADDAHHFPLPELTRDGLAQLESLAATAAALEQRRVGEVLGAARARVTAGEQELDALALRHSEIEAERDLAPPAPIWRRDARDGRPGAPLWQLVDFRDPLSVEERAGLEAALEGAGLLDAWVTPDGRLLDSDEHDVTLLLPRATLASTSVRDGTNAQITQTRTETRGLGALLVAEPGAKRAVPGRVVDAVLAAIAVGAPSAVEHRPGELQVRDLQSGEQQAESGRDADVWVGADGRWQVGTAHGRTSKPVAQYIGTTARAAERERRLADLDRRIADEQGAVGQARDAVDGAETALAAITGWLRARPRYDAVLAAWSGEAARREAVATVQDELAPLVAEARTARTEAAARHTDLLALGQRHRLPVTVEELAARAEQVKAVDSGLETVSRQASALDEAVCAWQDLAERARSDAADLVDRKDEQRRADEAWRLARTEHEEQSGAQHADIAELERRLTQHRAAAAAAKTLVERHTASERELTKAVGGLEQTVLAARAALEAQEPLRDAAFDALRALYRVAGLMAAAQVDADPSSLPSDRDAVKQLTDRATSGSQASANAVLQAVTQLHSGPAAVTEPRLLETDGVYAAVGRDEGMGDIPLSDLANRLAARVAADRELLTERERTLFETHVLGQLGDALRDVRRQAEELVTAMNDQLAVVTTSQGIRVRLRWRLRDDIPADARRAVELLGQPIGALLPSERTELRESLHRLIEISRAEAPEGSYTEHLARALDYRQWFTFTVQYQRPEVGEWRDLLRKSALSQGEQKVLCYLPLFAAAAAHFTSLAGAAPHAPRFVLLDDAFPKIDARTHPLLFGLLVDLDLDFVVTSERLWGTHATVPSLAIYEALRNPAERGIAQFEHRWDGHQLTAVGAGG